MKKLLLSLLCLGVLAGCGYKSDSNQQDSQIDIIENHEKNETKYFQINYDENMQVISLASGKYGFILPVNSNIVRSAGELNKCINIHSTKNDNVVRVSFSNHYVFDNEKSTYSKKNLYENFNTLSDFDGIDNKDELVYTGKWSKTNINNIDANKNMGDIKREDGSLSGRYASYTTYINGDTSYPLFIKAEVLKIMNENELMSQDDLDALLVEFLSNCVVEVDKEKDVNPVPFKFTENKYFKEMKVYGDWDDAKLVSLTYPIGYNPLYYSHISQLNGAKNCVIHESDLANINDTDSIAKAFDRFKGNLNKELQCSLYALNNPQTGTINSSSVEIVDTATKRNDNIKNHNSLPMGIEYGTVKYKYNGKTYTANYANAVVLAKDNTNNGGLFSFYVVSKDTKLDTLKTMVDELCDGVYMSK